MPRKTYTCEKCGKTFTNKKIYVMHMKAENLTRETIIHGLRINEGDCLKVVFSRFAYYIKVRSHTDNPVVILAEDVYGHELILNLAKAMMVQRLPIETWERRKRAVEGAQGAETKADIQGKG